MNRKDRKAFTEADKQRNAKSKTGCWRCDTGHDHQARVCARTKRTVRR